MGVRVRGGRLSGWVCERRSREACISVWVGGEHCVCVWTGEVTAGGRGLHPTCPKNRSAVLGNRGQTLRYISRKSNVLLSGMGSTWLRHGHMRVLG